MVVEPLAGWVVAFDLDGTLVDTAPDLIGSLNMLLREAGHAALPVAEARPFIGRGAKWLIERGFQRAGAPLQPHEVQPLFDRFIPHYLAHIADESRAFAGCEAALDALAAAGARLCVCTNKPTKLSVALLDLLGLSARFDCIVGPDGLPAMKPDPRHLIAAVEACGGRPARTIMVGDSAADAGAARAAGSAVVLVDFGYTETPVAELRPDAVISHYDQLADACLRLAGACEPRAGPL